MYTGQRPIPLPPPPPMHAAHTHPPGSASHLSATTSLRPITYFKAQSPSSCEVCATTSWALSLLQGGSFLPPPPPSQAPSSATSHLPGLTQKSHHWATEGPPAAARDANGDTRLASTALLAQTHPPIHFCGSDDATLRTASSPPALSLYPLTPPTHIQPQPQPRTHTGQPAAPHTCVTTCMVAMYTPHLRDDVHGRHVRRPAQADALAVQPRRRGRRRAAHAGEAALEEVLVLLRQPVPQCLDRGRDLARRAALALASLLVEFTTVLIVAVVEVVVMVMVEVVVSFKCMF